MEIQRSRIKSCGGLIDESLGLDKQLTSLQLVTDDNRTTVAQSRSRRQSGCFRKARDMSLEISEVVAFAVDIILLTFILVWRERADERTMYGLDPNMREPAPLTGLLGD